jgi:2-oxoglutarate dehydrogenase E2 component (dihydrolipoamide succinyltransferase)
MTDLEVIVPPNEEGTRATVLRWYKAVGDSVAKDEPLVELETDKVTVEVPAPASGILAEILKHSNDEVQPSEVLARLRPAAAPGAVSASATASPGTGTGTGTGASAGAAAGAGAGVAAEGSSAAADASDGKLSPAVRRLLREQSLDPADIDGSGRDGRITAEDISRHVSAKGATTAKTAAAEAAVPETLLPEASLEAGKEVRVPHSSMRRRIAEHMARSVAVAPHVTTLFEADLTRVLAHRDRHGVDFERQGARLTLTAYFVSACARALRTHPELNSSFEEDALVMHADCNIGVGTALGSGGLIVPVIHRAQELDLLTTAKRLGQMVTAARAGKLTPENVRGGTFTISNHGVGGSLLAAPIVINQPQVAILGIGKVERRVCVLDVEGTEAIGVRSMCFLTLTIDHRALDAFQANAFMTRIVSTLEQWPSI